MTNGDGGGKPRQFSLHSFSSTQFSFWILHSASRGPVTMAMLIVWLISCHLQHILKEAVPIWKFCLALVAVSLAAVFTAFLTLTERRRRWFRLAIWEYCFALRAVTLAAVFTACLTLAERYRRWLRLANIRKSIISWWLTALLMLSRTIEPKNQVPFSTGRFHQTREQDLHFS